MTWKQLARTFFQSTVVAANTNEIIAGQVAIKPAAGKTWLIKEILIGILINTSVAKFSNCQLYVLPNGGTDFVAADFSAANGFAITGAAPGAKSNNAFLTQNITTVPASTIGRNTLLQALDEVKCGFRSGATIPGAGDICVCVTLSGDEF